MGYEPGGKAYCILTRDKIVVCTNMTFQEGLCVSEGTANVLLDYAAHCQSSSRTKSKGKMVEETVNSPSALML